LCDRTLAPGARLEARRVTRLELRARPERVPPGDRPVHDRSAQAAHRHLRRLARALPEADSRARTGARLCAFARLDGRRLHAAGRRPLPALLRVAAGDRTAVAGVRGAGAGVGPALRLSLAGLPRRAVD